MVKSRSLQDLAGMKKTLADQAAREAAEAAERLAAERRAAAERNLFQRAIGAVQPLAPQPRVLLTGEPTPPLAFQQKIDEGNVLRESLSDDFDAPLKVALEWLVAALFRDQRTCLTRDFEGKFEC